eukprot:TRINITY_DN4769_c0_g3_i1.p1 TRINITY_DN4769_c0_g3~~TRINITY_DN4769_c0_g3_i1.p1  ORF type:complete len:362 (-),score=70.64 TRINITY_DN4769_c0_g3_i1:64-1149(-)
MNSKGRLLNVLFFGSGFIGRNVLEPLFLNKTKQFNRVIVNRLEVITHQANLQGSKRVNRDEIQIFCGQSNIQVHQPVSKSDPIQREKDWKALEASSIFQNDTDPFDLGIVASFGYMIPENIIRKSKNGMIVVHPSLLPKYRGAAPISRALLDDQKETGISLIEISIGKFDAGSIIYQEPYTINPDITFHDLGNELSKLAGRRLVEVLEDIENYRKNAIKQDESQTTKAPKHTPEETFVNWNETARQVYCRYRAFHGSNFKTIRTNFEDKIYLIDEIEQVQADTELYNLLQSEYPQAAPGSIWILGLKQYKQSLYVKCGGNSWVSIRGGYFKDKAPQPTHRFIEHNLSRDCLLYTSPSPRDS